MKIEIWHRLALLESVDYVRRQYKIHHSRSIGTDYALEITAPVRQSREFFESALNADPSIRLLLQYYGVLSLSRSLILLATRGRREATLAQAHGLIPRNWNDIISRNDGKLTELMVKVTTGTFSELRTATKGQSILRHNSNRPQVLFSPSKLELNDLEFNFVDLCRRDPNLSPMSERYLGYERLNCLVQEFQSSNESMILKIPTGIIGASDLDHLNRIVGCGKFSCQQNGERQLTLTISKDDIDNELAFTDKIDLAFSVVGDMFLQAKFSGAKSLSQLESMFAASYILSMISRYYPRAWLSLMNGTSKDEAYPLFLLVMDYIQVDFPRLVLEWLENGNFLPENLTR